MAFPGVDARELPDLVAGSGMVGVALFLLWLAPRDRVHRAFALLLVVVGGTSLSFVLAQSVAEPAARDAFAQMVAYFTLATPPAALFFAIRFLDPEGARGASRPLSWGLLALAALTLGAYAIDHAYLLGPLPEGGTVRPLGPLAILLASETLVFGAISLLLVLRARATDGARRTGALLAAAGFVALPAFRGAAWITGSLMGPSILVGPRLVLASIGILGWAHLVPIVAAALLLRQARAWEPRDARLARVYIGVAAVAAIVAIVVERFGASLPPLFEFYTTIDGACRLAIPAFVTYALLRHQLFDARVKLRWAIGKSTIAAVFIAVFFLASELAQQFFGATFGSAYVGIIAAGMLVFAMAPLQRAAERLAERAVPGGEAMASGREARVYARAVRAAIADGALTPIEEEELAHIAHELAIPHPEALRIRREIEEERARS